MDISQFDFDLPPELIAQEPAAQRDGSRLLVYERSTGRITHTTFSQLADFLPFPCRIIRNNATVLKARIFGKRPTGGAVECLLLKATAGDPFVWECMLKPGKKLPSGSTFGMDGEYTAEVLGRKESGEYLARIQPTREVEGVVQLVQRIGVMPLPPYIQRARGDGRAALDSERYQTTFANPQKTVAAAAPTAGLHFTGALNQQLAAKGAAFTDVTLHVGLGTFKPIDVDTVEEYQIHTETYEIPAQARCELDGADGRPRLCVGTTSVRSIEDYANKLAAGNATAEGDFLAEASIYIYPPYQFKLTDHLITNFHLPKSTLLCLISAFLDPGGKQGIEVMHRIYDEAIRERYRFFSYGDAMLIL